MTRAAAEINLKELMLAAQQQKFEDREKAANRMVTRNENRWEKEAIAFRGSRRSNMLSRFNARRAFLASWERDGRRAWKSNMVCLSRYERRLLSYELAMMEMEAACRRLSRTKHSNEQAEGTQWFEKNLEKLGLEPGSNGGDEPISVGNTLLLSKDSPAAFLDRLEQRVREQSFVPTSNAEAMQELHSRGKAGRKARNERQYRRCKAHLDQRQAQAEAIARGEEERRLQVMLDSARERRAAAAAHWERSWAREARERLGFKRLPALIEENNKRFQEAFEEWAAGVRANHMVVEAARKEEEAVLQVQLDKKREEKRAHATALGKEAVHKLVDLAVVTSEVRAATGPAPGQPLPPSLWKALKCRFISQEPFYKEAVPEQPRWELSHDPTLEARAFLEFGNYSRCRGWWYPEGCRGGVGLVQGEVAQWVKDPLQEALMAARKLVTMEWQGQRETFLPSGAPATLRVVMRGRGREEQLRGLCSELERWTGMYVCTLDRAVECAMAVASEEAEREESQGFKGAGSAKKGKEGVNRVTDGGSEDGGREGVTEGGVKVEPFSLQAREEDITRFKEVAATYHALKTNPKKASGPIPLQMTTSLLLTHLACKAPPARSDTCGNGGRGWILLDYPQTLLEAKMLENGLTGYSDEDVAAELNGGKVPKAAKGKGKGKGSDKQGEEEVPPPPRSGLDVVFEFTAPARPVSLGSNSNDKDSTDPPGSASRAIGYTGKRRSVSAKEEPTGGLGGEAGDGMRESEDMAQWWGTFEGGCLWCSVGHEANAERWAETLFLLLQEAEARKEDKKKREQNSGNTAQDCGEEGLRGGKTGGSIVEESVPPAQPLPWELPLTHSLEESRRKRRMCMPYATRVLQEAVMGERELDIERIQTVLTSWEDRGDDCYLRKVRSTFPLLEAECSAAAILDWLAHTEFAFASCLREPSERWAAACVELEGRLAQGALPQGAFTSNARVSAARGKLARAAGQPLSGQPFGPPSPENSVWEAVDDFESEAGNVVDDRHEAAEVAALEMAEESGRKVARWISGLTSLGAEVCVMDLERQEVVVEVLRSLHELVGLEGGDDTRGKEEKQGEEEEGGQVEGEGEEAGAGDSLQKECVAATEALMAEVMSLAGDRELGEGGTHLLSVVSNVRTGGTQVNSRRGHPHIERDLTDMGDREGEANAQQVNACDKNSSTIDDHATVEKEPASRDDIVLSQAELQSWLFLVYRVRWLVAKLERMFQRCEGVVSEAQRRQQRLKRRRAKLEHQAVGEASAVVRHTIGANNMVDLGDLLQRGVPMWVEDAETSAKDPGVSIPWGMNGLSLNLVGSLLGSLRTAAEGKSSLPAPVLVRAIMGWGTVISQGVGGGGALGQPLPPVWIDETYLLQLCQSIGSGETPGIPWRRLVHILALGHLPVFPTVDDLSDMMRASIVCNTHAVDGVKSSGSGLKARGGCSQLSLLNELEASNFKLWFEGRSGGISSSVEGDIAAMAKKIYMEAFGDGSGRVLGLELLLTLCCVPDRAPSASWKAGQDLGEA
ncbi:unnamed protein product [Discosporangium mesarthrocarpum]